MDLHVHVCSSVWHQSDRMFLSFHQVHYGSSGPHHESSRGAEGSRLEDFQRQIRIRRRHLRLHNPPHVRKQAKLAKQRQPLSCFSRPFFFFKDFPELSKKCPVVSGIPVRVSLLSVCSLIQRAVKDLNFLHPWWSHVYLGKRRILDLHICCGSVHLRITVTNAQYL